MTDTLSNLLHHQADQAHFAAPDIDAMVRTGDRRVRRRRTAWAAGGLTVAAAAVVAVATLTSVLPGDGAAPDPATPTTPTYPVQVRDQEPMFTIDQLVVEGERRVTLPYSVDSLVRTRVGWLYRSGDDVYSHVDGSSRRLNQADSSTFQLASDQDGVLAAWHEQAGDQTWISVVDQRSGDVTRIEPDDASGRDNAVELYDVEGDVVYWRDDRGTMAHDLGTGEERAVDQDYVLDVENGVVASMPDDVDGTLLSTPAGDVEIESGDVGVLSPDGAWYASDGIGFFGERIGVADTATGDVVRFDTGAVRGDAVIVTGWLDATTFAVALLAKADGDPDRLLTCQVPSGECTTVVDDVSSFSNLRGVGRTFPGGGHL